MNRTTLNRGILLGFAVALAVCCWHWSLVNAAPKVATETAAQLESRTIVNATTEFLNSLSADQRQKVQYAFSPQKSGSTAVFETIHGMGPKEGFVAERYGNAVWSNYPVSGVPRVSAVPRPGLQLGSLSSAQRSAVMHLLQVALSAKGYQKVLEIMGSDDALSQTHTSYCSGSPCYTIGIFGTPSETKPWIVEFGGHHLGVNITLAGPDGAITPTLTGAQPAVYTANGKTVRVLAGENDKAFALLDSLDEAQRKQAILTYQVDDLVLGPGHAGQMIQPEGVKGSALSEKQRAMLLDVIAEWANIVNDAYAEPRIAEIKSGLPDTYFAWSGPTTHKPGANGSSYYRIQGPKVIIEFSPQSVGGDLTMHVHTIYRDPTNDYGVRFTLPQ